MNLSTRKYKNKLTIVDGIRFDSLKEAARYGELKLMEKAGLILSLRLQPKYPVEVNGVKICTYIADFDYMVKHVAVLIVEDVKSEMTRKLPVYRLKKKLVEAIYGIEITEI